MNKIFLIILVILILYVIYNCFNNNEGFAVDPKSLTEIDAIKNLAFVAQELQTVKGLTLPGDLNTLGKITSGDIVLKDSSKSFTVNRGKVTFSNAEGDFNHSIYNNGYNIDQKGKWDGMKMNTYNGLDVNIGDANETVKTALSIDSIGSTTFTKHVGTNNSPNILLQNNTGQPSQLGFYTGLGAGALNNLVQKNDAAIINIGSNTTSKAGLVLAPWSNSTGGIRIDSDGIVTVGGGTKYGSPDKDNLTNLISSIILRTSIGDLFYQEGVATTSYDNWTTVIFPKSYKMLISYAAYDRDSGDLITRYAATPNGKSMVFDNQKAGSTKLPAKWIALGFT